MINLLDDLGNFKQKKFYTSKCKFFLHFKAMDPFVQLAQFFKVFLAPLEILENILAHLIRKKFGDIKKKQKN